MAHSRCSRPRPKHTSLSFLPDMRLSPAVSSCRGHSKRDAGRSARHIPVSGYTSHDPPTWQQVAPPTSLTGLVSASPVREGGVSELGGVRVCWVGVGCGCMRRRVRVARHRWIRRSTTATRSAAPIVLGVFRATAVRGRALKCWSLWRPLVRIVRFLAGRR